MSVSACVGVMCSPCGTPPAHRGKETLVAQDSRPAVTLSVVEDEVAAEDLVPILLVDRAERDHPRRTPSVDPSQPQRRPR
jgi:hypothetical protein